MTPAAMLQARIDGQTDQQIADAANAAREPRPTWLRWDGAVKALRDAGYADAAGASQRLTASAKLAADADPNAENALLDWRGPSGVNFGDADMRANIQAFVDNANLPLTQADADAFLALALPEAETPETVAAKIAAERLRLYSGDALDALNAAATAEDADAALKALALPAGGGS
ncbi:hypothetical protein [Alienimonas sp. DA493]|uniref:hypothetical protein n=1 Tax=Alienimonas sp. DA493 TaxID=3373605 RepID=UPI0037541AC1